MTKVIKDLCGKHTQNKLYNHYQKNYTKQLDYAKILPINIKVPLFTRRRSVHKIKIRQKSVIKIITYGNRNKRKSQQRKHKI